MPKQRSMAERICSQCSNPFACRTDAKTRFCSPSCKGEARLGSVVSSDLRATIVRLYTEEMLSGEQIAPLVKKTPSNVYLHLKRAGIPVRGKPAAPRVACICKHCGIAFEVSPADARRGYTNFCGLPCSRAHRKRPLVDRFWPMVNKTGPCWLWTGSLDGSGYGQINLNGRPARASRISWEMANGPIPSGLWVLHNCPGGDNPQCVNPAHLWLGTAQDNARDMTAKGRHWSQRE